MISIIVSSINEAQVLSFKQNIAVTIGCEYELLIHDNRQTHWSLCKVYNHYASHSRYPILCFFHEDIIFHTQGWGQILIDFFATHSQAGVVGFAGSTIKTECVSGWGTIESATREHLIQRFPDGKLRSFVINPHKETFSEVALLDGVALITTATVWSEHRFDEELFRRFHIYDLDFTMQVAQHYTNYVCHTIDIEHLSRGSYTKEWLCESEKFITKWRDRLPFSVCAYSDEFIRKCRNADRYRIARMRLQINGDQGSVAHLWGMMAEARTPVYKLKLIKYIAKACWRRLIARRPRT